MQPSLNSPLPHGRRSFIRLSLVAAGALAVPLLQACGAPAQPTAAPKPTEPPKPAAAAPTTAPAAAPPTTAPAAAKPTEAAKPAAAAPTAASAAAKPTEAAKSAAAPTTASAPAAAKGGKIVAATRIGGDADIMAKSVAAFTQETGIPAEAVNYGQQAEYMTKVQALHASKQAPDVIWASLGAGYYEFANRGLTTEIDSLIKSANYDMADFLPNAVKTMQFKGKLYGLPWGGHPGDAGLLYNVDLLNKGGVTVTDDPASVLDWTYDTLVEAAKKTTVSTGGRVTQYGYFPLTSELDLINYMGAFGARLLSEDGTKVDLESEPAIKALTYISDLFNKHKVSPTPDPSQVADQWFATGRIAMVHSGYWGQFQPGEVGIKGAFKWNCSLQPKGPAGKRGTNLMINGQCVSSLSASKENAFRFIGWLTEPKNNVAIVLAGGGRPALRTSVLDSPELVGKMKAHKVWAQAIKDAEPHQLPANLRWSEFAEALSNTLAGVWAGTQTLEQALPTARKTVQGVLDKPPA